MVLGQILTTQKNIEVNDYILITNDKNSLNYDLPTLIVGKSKAKEIIGEENMKYLNKKVNDKLYWTFGKTERRDEYEKDIKSFNDLIINMLLKDVNYKYINIFGINRETFNDFLNIIKNDKKKTFLLLNNTIYLYYEKVVYGISLNELKYFGVNIDNFLSLLRCNSNNYEMKNQYSISKKMREMFKNNIFLIPYIYFLEKFNKKNDK